MLRLHCSLSVWIVQIKAQIRFVSLPFCVYRTLSSTAPRWLKLCLGGKIAEKRCRNKPNVCCALKQGALNCKEKKKKKLNIVLEDVSMSACGCCESKVWGFSGYKQPWHTFEEDKFAIVALVGCVDVARQADPEDRYRHGVVIQDPVPPHTPEPATLHQRASMVFNIR